MDGTNPHYDATQSQSERKSLDHNAQAFHAHAHFMQDHDPQEQEDDVVYEDVVDIDDTMGTDEGVRSNGNSTNYFGDVGTQSGSHGGSNSHHIKSGKRPHSEMAQTEEDEVVREIGRF